MVFSSHIVSDIERLANRIWILKEGRLFWQGGLDSLKESIVRVHLRCERELPENLNFPGLLSLRRMPGGGTAVVRDWTEATHSELIRRSGGREEVETVVETLALEEIFLELHR